MSRVQDIALGGGLFVLLAALVACAVQMVLEVLAVERDRRKASGEVRATARRTPDPARSAPSPDDVPPDEFDAPGMVIVGLSDDVFAETVRRAHPDLTEWAS